MHLILHIVNWALRTWTPIQLIAQCLCKIQTHKDKRDKKPWCLSMGGGRIKPECLTDV